MCTCPEMALHRKFIENHPGFEIVILHTKMIVSLAESTLGLDLGPGPCIASSTLVLEAGLAAD